MDLSIVVIYDGEVWSGHVWVVSKSDRLKMRPRCLSRLASPSLGVLGDTQVNLILSTYDNIIDITLLFFLIKHPAISWS